MGEIVTLPVKKKTAAKIPEGSYYFCVKCDSEHFKLSAEGKIYCVSCGSFMKNISVHCKYPVTK